MKYTYSRYLDNHGYASSGSAQPKTPTRKKTTSTLTSSVNQNKRNLGTNIPNVKRTPQNTSTGPIPSPSHLPFRNHSIPALNNSIKTNERPIAATTNSNLNIIDLTDEPSESIEMPKPKSRPTINKLKFIDKPALPNSLTNPIPSPLKNKAALNKSKNDSPIINSQSKNKENSSDSSAANKPEPDMQNSSVVISTILEKTAQEDTPLMQTVPEKVSSSTMTKNITKRKKKEETTKEAASTSGNKAPAKRAAKTLESSKSKPASNTREAKSNTRSKKASGKTSDTKRKRTINVDDSNASDEGDESDEDDRPRKRSSKLKANYTVLPILNTAYKLSLVMKGHIDINPPVKTSNEKSEESPLDIWGCEFEPSIDGKPNKIVATCGSYTVLFIDIQQGRYVKKYTHSEAQEIFYCMAWTTLEGQEQMLNNNLDEDYNSCNILAVAGRLGSIKLFNPLQNECYRYLFGHKKAVLKLAFAKAEPRWLLSASADRTVRLWDIGSPTTKHDDSVCLAKFNIPGEASVPASISISFDLSMVLVGCTNGDMIRYGISKKLVNKFRNESVKLRESAMNPTKFDKWAAFGPIETISSSNRYSTGSEWHEGYVDDVYIFGQDGDGRNKLNNKIVSRGSEDMEIIVWDPAKSTSKDAEIEKSLKWPDSLDSTGLRFKVVEQDGQKILIAGEYDGQIHIFNIGDTRKSKTLKDGSKELLSPDKILSHQMSTELIRDVTCSSDTRTIVAVDNNNTCFIWSAKDT